MSWHYQVMKHKDGTYAIHEYYPDIEGSAGYTCNPIAVEGDSVDDLVVMLKHMMNDIHKHGVKDYE